MRVLVGCMRVCQPRSLHSRNSGPAMVKTSIVAGTQHAASSKASEIGSKLPVASRKRDRFSTFAASLTHSHSAGEVSKSVPSYEQEVPLYVAL